MCFALDGGVWLHRHSVRGEPMVHLVSTDKARLLTLGLALELRPEWLQYKPLKDPRTGIRVPAWHWDVWGSRLRLLDAEMQRLDAQTHSGEQMTGSSKAPS